MKRKTTTIVAIAALAFATTLFPGGDDAVALAQAVAAPPAEPVSPAELVPAAPAIVAAEPVVQPLPAPPAPAAAPAAESLADMVAAISSAAPLDAELHCLAGAVYFEARGEPLAGQLAVAQVIVNRSQDRRFARTYCGVVAQPGQFSFMRGRTMPAVRTGTLAWQRAAAIARIAHERLWTSEAGEAVFFHARHVRPGWSRSKTRLAQIDTHIFYR